MDLFENKNNEQIKDKILHNLDKIIDDKKIIYEQIKSLETEKFVISNNIEYFEAYLNYLEYRKMLNKSNNNNDYSKENSEIKFEDYLNIRRNQEYNNNNNNNNINNNESVNILPLEENDIY